MSISALGKILNSQWCNPEETHNCVAEANNTTGREEVNRIYKLRIGEQSGALASLVRGLFTWP